MTRPWVCGMVAMLLGACSGTTQPDEAIRVTIPLGASVASVTDSLLERGVIDGPRWFKLYVKLVGRETSLQAGVYDFASEASVPSIVRMVSGGRTAQDRFVVLEGLTLEEISASAETQLGIPAERLRAAASDPALVRRVAARGTTLEGYLYPETYNVRVGVSAAEIVRQMVEQFETRWMSQWNGRLDTLGMTRDEAITLASIIEAEIHSGEDRFYVSSVYHNRLARGMRLEADPTVIYALGERRRLFNRDYQFESPYNTYLIDGLPPHAIGQPSAASMEAALYPRESDFLFFVAGPEGKHVFTRTYREHQAAIRRIRSSGPEGR